MATGNNDNTTPNLKDTGTIPKTRHSSGSQDRSKAAGLNPNPNQEGRRVSPIFDEEEFLKNFSHLTILSTDTEQEKKLKNDLAKQIVTTEKANREIKFLQATVQRQAAEDAKRIFQNPQAPPPFPKFPPTKRATVY